MIRTRSFSTWNTYSARVEAALLAALGLEHERKLVERAQLARERHAGSVASGALSKTAFRCSTSWWRRFAAIGTRSRREKLAADRERRRIDDRSRATPPAARRPRRA